jgi:hypothetical protein
VDWALRALQALGKRSALALRALARSSPTPICSEDDMGPITQSRVQELFDYDPLAGAFTRRCTSGRAKAGDSAGFVGTQGYLVVAIDGKRYCLHRIAFLWMNGAWPEGHVDHIDGDRLNNRWANLRSVAQLANNQNHHRARVDNLCGYLGVKTRRYGFQARICVEGRHLNLGCYKTPQEAHEVYLEAKRKMHIGCTI